MKRTKIDTIVKRDGKIVPFNSAKIDVAIQRAADEVGWISEEDRNRVVRQALIQLFDVDVIDVETVQDIVEEELMAQGHHQIAKAYILYRERARYSRE